MEYGEVAESLTQRRREAESAEKVLIAFAIRSLVVAQQQLALLSAQLRLFTNLNCSQMSPLPPIQIGGAPPLCN